jgi:hypothetical protein
MHCVLMGRFGVLIKAGGRNELFSRSEEKELAPVLVIVLRKLISRTLYDIICSGLIVFGHKNDIYLFFIIPCDALTFI